MAERFLRPVAGFADDPGLVPPAHELGCVIVGGGAGERWRVGFASSSIAAIGQASRSPMRMTESTL